eukprot:3420936-Rhodomonas_salina.4
MSTRHGAVGCDREVADWTRSGQAGTSCGRSARTQSGRSWYQHSRRSVPEHSPQGSTAILTRQYRHTGKSVRR